MTARRNALIGGICILAALLGNCPRLWAQAAFVQKAVLAGPKPPSTAPAAHAVNADEEMIGFVRQAEKLIAEGTYDRAIEILQALINRDEAGFYPLGDGQRFISIRQRASDLIGSMGPEGLKLYRSLYDPQAQRLFEQALAEGNMPALRAVGLRYAHTTSGRQCLDRLGAMHFDRGEFDSAARYWRQLASQTGQTSPMLLAKMATASRLAGREADAKRLADELIANHPQATLEIAGDPQTPGQFAQALSALTPWKASDTARVWKDAWPGLGGLPAGQGYMAEADNVLTPRVRLPQRKDSGTVASQMLALRDAAQSLMQLAMQYRNNNMGAGAVGINLKLRRGHLQVAGNIPNQTISLHLPAALEPVVADGDVLYRDEEGVVAWNLATGKLRWRSYDLPVKRQVNIRNMNYYFGGYLGMNVADPGRHMLTVGEGLVFVRHGFLPSLPNLQHVIANNPKAAKGLTDSSALAAISIQGQGRLVWSVGNGAGDAEILKVGKFVSPVSYSDGRVYAVVQHLESYHLVCLRASSGQLLWKNLICQTPGMVRNYGINLDWLLERMSPPAVADGIVYACTGTGVLAAHDAQSGQARWAYQYSSDMARLAQGGYQPFPPGQGPRPLNPIVVAGGLVICLPPDANDLLALGAHDGQLAWKFPREDQQYLAWAGEAQVVLASPGLYVLSAKDGKKFVGHKNKSIAGRPAVTPSAVLASGPGVVYRLGLREFDLRSVGMAESDSLLGNLVSVQGDLLAANALGVSVYSGYEQAVTRLTAAMETAAEPQRRVALLMERGGLSFSARRFDKALADFVEAQPIAQTLLDPTAAAQVRVWLYRTHVVMGAVSGDARVKLDHFRQAMELAQTSQEKALMTLRLAKCHEKLGELAAAAELADRLGMEYPDEPLADVSIDNADSELARQDEETPTVPARLLSRELIAHLIEKHGREAFYKDFDARAQAAYRQGLQRRDPQMLANVAERWPDSSWADDALLAAGEILYARTDGEDQTDDLTLAAALLARVDQMPDSPLRAHAAFGLGLMHRRQGRPLLAALCLEKARLAGASELAFADRRGPSGQLLGALMNDLPVVAPAPAPAEAITPPLAVAFEVQDPTALLIGDSAGQPDLVDGKALVLRGNKAQLLDLSAESAEAAVAWEGLVETDSAGLIGAWSLPASARVVSARSADNKLLALCDRKNLTTLRLDNARQDSRGELSAGNPGSLQMATGAGVIVLADPQGALTCIDIASRAVRWKTRIKTARPNVPIVPQVGPNAVLAVCDQTRQMVALDLRTGKMVGKWQGSTRVEAAFAPSGLLVVLVDRRLMVYETNLHTPAYTAMVGGSAEDPPPGKSHSRSVSVAGDPAVAMGRTAKLEASSFVAMQGAQRSPPQPALLGLSRDVVVLTPNMQSNEVEVRSLTGGGAVVCRTPLRKDGKYMLYPVWGTVDNGHLYLVCSRLPGIRPVGLAVGQNPLATPRGLVAARVALADGRLDWAVDVLDENLPNTMLAGRTLCQSHLLLLARTQGNPQQAKLVMIRRADGQVSQEVQVGRADAAHAKDPKAQMRCYGLRSVVTDGGRVAVETQEGIRVYAQAK